MLLDMLEGETDTAWLTPLRNLNPVLRVLRASHREMGLDLHFSESALLLEKERPGGAAGGLQCPEQKVVTHMLPTLWMFYS